MPDPRDLTTLASVKLLMQKSGANATSQDSLIAQEITRASVKIMRDTGREFVPGGPNSEPNVNTARTFEFVDADYGDEAFIDLNPYDLQKTLVPTLVIDPDTTTPTTVAASQYRLWPQPPSQGVYMAIKVLPLQGNTAPVAFRNRQIQVTGNWGFPAIPEEVAQACDETVVHWITSYPARGGAPQMDAAVAPVVPRSYPMTAIDLLEAFWRRAI